MTVEPRQPRARAVVTATIPMTVHSFQREMIRQLQERGLHVTVVSSPGEQLAEVAADLGTDFVTLPMSRSLSPLRDVRGLLQWIHLLRTLRPQLVVTATPKASLLSMVAAKLVRVPQRLYSAVGLRLEGEHGWRRILLTAMEKLTTSAASVVVANSPSLAARYLELRLVAPAKLRRTQPASSHGVDTHHFKPQARDRLMFERLGLLADRKVIGFVGRLTHDKGIDDLLTAAKALNSAGTSCQLLVVGSQDEADSLRYVQLLRTAGVPVVTTGQVDDVRPYFSCMDVHVLPTLREGFPNVVLEAGAMAVPTVTTRATGSVDSVVDGVTGLLVDVQDAHALSEALHRLLTDTEFAERIGRAARDATVRDYDPQRVVESHLRPVLEGLPVNHGSQRTNNRWA